MWWQGAVYSDGGEYVLYKVSQFPPKMSEKRSASVGVNSIGTSQVLLVIYPSSILYTPASEASAIPLLSSHRCSSRLRLRKKPRTQNHRSQQPGHPYCPPTQPIEHVEVRPQAPRSYQASSADGSAARIQASLRTVFSPSSGTPPSRGPPSSQAKGATKAEPTGSSGRSKQLTSNSPTRP